MSALNSGKLATCANLPTPAMILLQELKKITRQIRGRQSMFDYHTTPANQLYLLCCLFGNIYFTDKIHIHVKLIWYFMASCHVFLTYYVGLVFILYNKKKPIMMSLYVIGLQFMGNVVQIGLPLMCYYCRSNIRSMIRKVDKIYQDRSAGDVYKTDASLDPKMVIIGNLSMYVACNFVRLFSCILDAIIFYDEAKLNNYLYYIYPLPKIINVTSLAVFLFINACFNLIFMFAMMQWLALLAFMLFWSTICYNQLILVSHKLDIETAYMTGYVEKTNKPSKAWNRAFKRSLIQGVKKFQKIIRLINLARKFVELFCSLVFPVVFVLQVTLLHHILSTNVPFCVLIKGIMGFIGLLWTVYLIFWIGEALESSVSIVSMAVYSMPWYWSTKVRQNFHLFLSQTQKLNSFPIAKVHPLNYKTFTAYSNGILSSVNILRDMGHKFGQ